MRSKKIIKEKIINAPRSEVWKAWTTTEGLKGFFAPEANVELRLNGPYELYFLLENEPGLRGSEGCKVLSFLDEEMLSFTWNAPPEFPEERGQHTFVVIQFYDEEEGKTRVKLTHAGWNATLTHCRENSVSELSEAQVLHNEELIMSNLGWKEGRQWDQVFDYFEKAWDMVLGSLGKRFGNSRQ